MLNFDISYFYYLFRSGALVKKTIDKFTIKDTDTDEVIKEKQAIIDDFRLKSHNLTILTPAVLDIFIKNNKFMFYDLIEQIFCGFYLNTLHSKQYPVKSIRKFDFKTEIQPHLLNLINHACVIISASIEEHLSKCIIQSEEELRSSLVKEDIDAYLKLICRKENISQYIINTEMNVPDIERVVKSTFAINIPNIRELQKNKDEIRTKNGQLRIDTADKMKQLLITF